jgi:hypothetical protein
MFGWLIVGWEQKLFSHGTDGKYGAYLCYTMGWSSIEGRRRHRCALSDTINVIMHHDSALDTRGYLINAQFDGFMMFYRSAGNKLRIGKCKQGTPHISLGGINDHDNERR